MPITFRYNVAPVASHSTQVFRPNVDGRVSTDSMKYQMLGRVYQGNFNKVINNKRAALVWEAITC